jgi:hypothetical protein
MQLFSYVSQTAFTLAQAEVFIGVPAGSLDPSFGIVLLDQQHERWCVRCQNDAIVPTNAAPFSDPKIGPFGPVL